MERKREKRERETERTKERKEGDIARKKFKRKQRWSST